MSKIEWTQQTWNPILGCSKISAGCRNCYAINQAYRNAAIADKLMDEGKDAGRLKYYRWLTKKDNFGMDWEGNLVFVPEALEIPVKRKKPTVYFVNSMSDLFHDKVEKEWIDQIFDIVKQCPQHIFQVLTKRAENLQYFDFSQHTNLWLGVTCEDQKTLDKRLPLLLQANAKIKFLSCEPLLEEINLDLDGLVDLYDEELGDCTIQPKDQLSWVIVGGESGHNARQCNISWIRSVVNQCQEFNIPVFVKQLGQNAIDSSGNKLKFTHKKGGDIDEFPDDLKIREFPVIKD